MLHLSQRIFSDFESVKGTKGTGRRDRRITYTTLPFKFQILDMDSVEWTILKSFQMQTDLLR